MEQGDTSEGNAVNESTKKRPFNKKKWREQKYNKHHKIEEWQERRKKIALHKYRKMLRKEYNTAESTCNNKPKGNEKYTRPSKYKRALQEYERKCQEREAVKQEALRTKVVKEAARQKSLAIRAERQQKLSKKTQKGQPLMKGRIEMMLEKIQQMQ